MKCFLHFAVVLAVTVVRDLQDSGIQAGHFKPRVLGNARYRFLKKT